MSGPYPVTFDVSPAGAGTLQVNSINPPQYPWSTSYFGGIQTNLQANANAGWVFSHWTHTSGAMGLATSVPNNFINLTGPNTIVAVFVPDVPDIDGDGCLNVDELLAGTDPSVADTDGDGENDCLEIGITSLWRNC